MESLSKQELISTITKQADQIKRYEGRLRDVVAAYKGLVKEKEALDISIKALTKTEVNVEANSQSKAQAINNPYPARVDVGEGVWDVPRWYYGSANPKALSAGQTRRQYGPVLDGRSVSASTSVGIDSSGKGYYDQSASVSN